MKNLCRKTRGRGRQVTGLVLVTLGLFWFAHKAGWIPAHGDGPALFWPLLTIIVGIVLLAGIGRKPREERE